ncbi:hypothetical protein [Sinimarinibacterium thermocellulolyticum]|uniref:DUF4412 domain-containing protein n=1 Tax=Sinimarinibacterium thermocellulolyticum TaxID=3170016 RepID=A0ABV2AAJ0_9GAMM
MNLSRTLIAIAVAATPAWAWAGGKAVVEAGEGSDKQRITYEFDGALLRMDVPQQDGNYMIMRDGKIYSVTEQNGQPMVIDMSGMGKMLGGIAQQSMASVNQDVDQFISLSDTGRTETVAGISGKVHVLTYVDDGERKTEEIVLSNDKNLREMSDSMMLVSETMAKAFGVQIPEGSKRMSAELKGQGVLRFGTQYKLVSLSGSTPPPSRFTLPAQPQQMPDLGSLFSGGAAANADAGAAGAANTGGGNPLGGLFGQKAQRQQERVEDRANQEVDQATDEAVDKVLDKAFEKLFGG